MHLKCPNKRKLKTGKSYVIVHAPGLIISISCKKKYKKARWTRNLLGLFSWESAIGESGYMAAKGLIEWWQ